MIGFKYIEDDNFFWRHHFNSLLPLTPPLITPQIDKNKAKKLLNANSSLLIRWESNFDFPKETQWWHIIKDSQVDLGSYSRNTRSKVRRGNKKYAISIVDKSEIIKFAYPIYRDTFNSYTTFEHLLSESEFKKELIDFPSFSEFWIIKHRDTSKYVGFCENIVLNNTCFYNTIWVTPYAKKKYASYILIHEMNKYYLNDKGFKFVSDGARSVSHQTNIHDFLQSKFGFRRAYCKLNVVYRWDVGLLIHLLFPFKNLIKKVSYFNKITVLLKQESIRRSFET